MSNKNLFWKKNAGKNAQIINIFWSAILIFFIIVESMIVLMITASKGESKLDASRVFLSGEIYGPVIPIYVISDDSLSSISKSGTQNDDISQAFRDKLSTLRGYQGFTAEILSGNIPDDASYSLDPEGNYKEIFYFYRSDTSYVKMTLLAKLVKDE